MGQRNMPCASQMIDLEMDQRNRGYMLPEPCVVLGGVRSFPQNIQTIVRASGNISSLDAHQHYDSAIFYGTPLYHGVPLHHSANVDIGVATASNSAFNSYVPYMPTPSSGMPVSRGSSYQFPSSSNFGVIGVSTEDYRRNNCFMDNLRGSYKSKNTEGSPRSFQYLNAPASSSSLIASLHTRHSDGVTPTDATSFALPQYRGNGTPSIREVESQRCVRNILVATGGMDPVLGHSHNHFFQRNFIGQPFQRIGWLEQQSDGGASAWTRAPAITYVHGSNVNGAPVESGNIVVQLYPEIASNRSSFTYRHPPLNVQHHSFHYPSPPVQGVSNHNPNIVHPQAAAASYRVPSSYSAHSTMNLSQDGLEMVPRHMGAVPPTGFRIYRSPEGPVPEATLRQQNLPHHRALPLDGVALLEIPDFYEVGNFIDHHRDMRLDIEDMSYEELLALGERIGNVNSGLSEEAVTSQLKTRIYLLATTNANLEEPASAAQEPDSCIICQEVYRDHEKIGTLDCCHEYHAKCLKKWLFIKNVCPICKSEALATKS